METKWKKSCSSCLDLTTLLAVLLLLQSVLAAEENDIDQHGHCNGSMGFCDENGNKAVPMKSETSRRFLETTKYITLGALKPNLPVCGGDGERGAPYSRSCLPPPSNPEGRGWSQYYRCRK
ncbi:Protein RALF-like 32 [Camellia lanceoleosa]|uniref:Protein RALF-like 32 n=1 Tax=Camellia lanceoleosa TaxID=1840588 RepID=A0ACC0GYL6_9ERIC|nr:Protein RALF-like 32 [Camellia lanceoleosa]